MAYNVVLKIFIGMMLVLALISVVQADEAISFTDAMGREISLEKPAETLAYYMVGDPVKIVGAWDKVIARDGMSSDERFYPNAGSIPAISAETGYMNLDYEKLMELKPDVVIIGKQDWDLEGIQKAIDSLEPEIPVVVLDFLDLNTMADNYEKLGKLTGNTEAAQDYLAFFDSVISPIKSKTSTLADSEKPNVFLQAHGMSSPDELYTYGGGFAAANALLGIVGANNVAAEISGPYSEFDSEWLIGKDVDVIVKEVWEGFYPEWVGLKATDPANKISSAQKIREETLANEIYTGSEAITNDRVYLADHFLWNHPVAYVSYLAKWIHPELFGNLEPEKTYQEYLTKYLKTDVNLDDVGIAGYP
ncbi:ABC transporter substrate-binding protein [Methanospirillum stamsii]|uniref:ABC transporter substrate-binding protein n=1 Tax=Methanospirillum stamsii TaxID=1277351 RepID=A0A2V2MPT9_9EURY|nr:ABC transporter substrate-binding protein [Methanospirillum stamsii]PWR70234.1 ABC transporter substrate-binding protein [Methanospirillum stamsii]